MPVKKFEFMQLDKVIHTCYSQRNVDSYSKLLEYFNVTDYKIVETQLKFS